MHGNTIRPVRRELRGILRRFRRTARPLLRLVCFPWAGAGASVYRRLALELPDTVDVLAVQLPGREDRCREPGLTCMALAVEHVLGELVPLLDRPLVLFGHSMGALVAYEVAQASKTRFGHEPDLLVVSGSGAPGVEEAYERCASDASDEVFIEDIRRLGGTPEQVLANPALMRLLLPALRTDYALLDEYAGPRGLAPLSCPVIACAGDRDESVSSDTVDAWRRCTTGAFEEHWLSGDHFYLAAHPQPLADCLRSWTAALASYPSSRVQRNSA